MRKNVLSRIAEAGAKLQQAELRLEAAKAEQDEAEKEVRACRRELEQLVLGANESPQTDEQEAVAPTSDDATEVSLTDLVKEWFEANPEAEARAADLVEAEVGTNADSLRSTMHRLVKEGYLAKSGKGLFKRAPMRPKGVISIGGSAA